MVRPDGPHDRAPALRRLPARVATTAIGGIAAGSVPIIVWYAGGSHVLLLDGNGGGTPLAVSLVGNVGSLDARIANPDRPAVPHAAVALHGRSNLGSNREFHGGGASAGAGGGGGSLSLNNNSNINNCGSPVAAADRLLAMTAVADATVTNTDFSWVDLLPSTVFYAWQLVRVYVLYPLSRALCGANRPYNHRNSKRRGLFNRSTPTSRGGSGGLGGAGQATSSSSTSIIGRRNVTTPRSRVRQTIDAIQGKFQQASFHLVIQYGPSLQFCLSLGVFLYYKWHIYEYRTGKSPLSLFYSSETLAYRETTILSVSTQNTNIIRQAAGKYGDRSAGVYEPMLQPTVQDVLFVMLAFGTLFCLFVFSRLVPPLPDLVAGGNVINDVRQEARAAAVDQSANSSSSNSPGSGKRGSRQRSWWLPWPFTALKYVFGAFVETSPGTVTASDAAPWTERQRSIVLENRLHMAMTVLVVRCLENLVLFGILPRTHFACRATGHCLPGPPVWELARILYPGGHTQARRWDGWSMFHFMERDSTSLVWTIFGVLFISVLMLVAQTVTLSKSYLSTMAYISGEWVLVDGARQKHYNRSSPKSLQSSSVEPAVWDPKRKYKKGELVNYGNAVFQATNNGPEGKPRDRELYGLNECLKRELGHSSTSTFLSDLATLPILVLILHMLVYCVYFAVGLWHCTYGIPCAMVAHSVAAYALVSLARPGAHNMTELKQLHAEMLGQTSSN